MKKSLLLAASFFALGALWMSPLQAMDEDDYFKDDSGHSYKRHKTSFPDDLENYRQQRLSLARNLEVSKKQQHFLERGLEKSNGSQAEKKSSISGADLDKLERLEVIKNARLNSLVYKTDNKYSIDDYRKARNSYLDLGKKYSNEDIFKEGAVSCAHQVTDFKDEATVQDWRIARDAYSDIGNYEIAHYFITNFPANTPLEVDDRRKARFICLQIQAFERAYEHSQKVVEMLGNNTTFEDYYHLILSDIGSHGYDDLASRERVNGYIKNLGNKWGQAPEVGFFISFLGEMKEFGGDFSNDLAEHARNLDVNRATPFIQALKIFVLEDFEDIEPLEIEFCEQSSRDRDNSQLKLIRTIYESL